MTRQQLEILLDIQLSTWAEEGHISGAKILQFFIDYDIIDDLDTQPRLPQPGAVKKLRELFSRNNPERRRQLELKKKRKLREQR